MMTIEEITLIRAPVERCFDLARSVEVHLLGNSHFGEQALARGARTSGLIREGERVTWRARHFWFWHELTSEITRLERPDYFRDVMVRGIFRSMAHDHYFRQLQTGQTQMRDVFVFEAPLPALGRVAESEEWRKYVA